MTRWIGTALIAAAAVSATLASATESQARGHRSGCGSNGGGGSWGNRGSNGGGGSFGGLFSRGRNGGSHGGGWGSNGGRHSNGWGSNGGNYHSDGCGSHGGAYHGDVVVGSSADSGQGEVRYYGERVESTAPMAAPAPILEDGTQGSNDQDLNSDSSRGSQDLNQGQDVDAPSVPDQPGAVQQNIDQPAGTIQSNPIPNSPPQGAGTAGEVGT